MKNQNRKHLFVVIFIEVYQQGANEIFQVGSDPKRNLDEREMYITAPYYYYLHHLVGGEIKRLTKRYRRKEKDREQRHIPSKGYIQRKLLRHTYRDSADGQNQFQNIQPTSTNQIRLLGYFLLPEIKIHKTAFRQTTSAMGHSIRRGQARYYKENLCYAGLERCDWMFEFFQPIRMLKTCEA